MGAKAQEVKAEIEALWQDVLPALTRSWDAYEQLHGVPASAWPEQERALFDLKPSLYRGYTYGLTPAQEHGSARQVLIEQLGDFAKCWGYPVLLADLEAHLNVQIRAAK